MCVCVITVRILQKNWVSALFKAVCQFALDISSTYSSTTAEYILKLKIQIELFPTIHLSERLHAPAWDDSGSTWQREQSSACQLPGWLKKDTTQIITVHHTIVVQGECNGSIQVPSLEILYRIRWVAIVYEIKSVREGRQWDLSMDAVNRVWEQFVLLVSPYVSPLPAGYMCLDVLIFLGPIFTETNSTDGHGSYFPERHFGVFTRCVPVQSHTPWSQY